MVYTMDTELKDNMLFVLKNVRELLRSDHIRISELKRLSNQLMEDVSLMHNKDSISISVLVYSLYKIFSKNSNISREALLKYLDDAIRSIDNQTIFRTRLKKLFDQIKKYDKELGVTILQTIRHAQVKKGLKVYEHGMSIGQAAEIMGVSRWDILEYLGDFKIDDEGYYDRVDARQRLSFAKGLFR
ncbi:hypothetical protein H6503_02630 [Candidatus Woesearchaeota archaeon]|nr:hypothetical protein [Candidatus Woesearchaeota archaeon]